MNNCTVIEFHFDTLAFLHQDNKYNHIVQSLDYLHYITFDASSVHFAAVSYLYGLATLN